MLYDSHVHIGTPKVSPRSQFLGLPGYKMYAPNCPRKFIKVALTNAIQRAFAFPFPFPDQPIERLNTEVVSAARRYPFFFTPLLLAKQVKDVSAYVDLIAGVKDHFYLQERTALPNAELLDFLCASNKMYLFHAHMNHWKSQIKYITRNFRHLNVVVAHCARNPFNNEKESLERVDELVSWLPSRKRQNVYFETSTILYPSVIKKMIDVFGPDHVLWGSDYPYRVTKGEDVLQKEIEVIEDATTDIKDRDLVLWGNHRRLAGLNTLDIRHSAASDAPDVLRMIDEIDEPDAGFLALRLKRTTIRSQARKASHLLVARNDNNALMGFLRWSDRPKGGMIIEEVYVSPNSRGRGVATKLVSAISSAYDYVDAKTFANNTAIVKVFTKLGFTPVPTSKKTMINWRRRSWTCPAALREPPHPF